MTIGFEIDTNVKGLGSMMDMLDAAAVVYQIVLTKCDKLKAAALEQRSAAIRDRLARKAAAFPEIIATSARSGAGIEQLRASLAPLAEPEPLR